MERMIFKMAIVVGVCLLSFFLGTLNNNINFAAQETCIIEYNYNQPTTLNGAKVNGYFDPTSGILTVFTQGRSKTQNEHTMLHEWGHYLDYLSTNSIIVDETFAENYAVNHKLVGVK